MMLKLLYKWTQGKEFMDILKGGDHRLETAADVIRAEYMRLERPIKRKELPGKAYIRGD